MVNKGLIRIAALCIAICFSVSIFYMGNIISNGEHFEVFTWQLVQKVFLIIGGLGASFSLFLAVIVFEKGLLQEELDMLEEVRQELIDKVSLNKSKMNNFAITADVFEYIKNDSEKFIGFIEDTRLVYYQNEFKNFLIRTEKVICTLPEDAKVYFLPLLLRITYFDKENLNKDNFKKHVLELNMEYDKARKIMEYDKNEWEEEKKTMQEKVNAVQKLSDDIQKKTIFKKGDK
ncbi:hypothetical protein AF927_12415 [Listeria monocytogenes]|uniref:hypothetical protein n=1 Tax=Listeria monocytogenes TaxID=1639 RepID=UPI00086D04E1|nr:hypothetical protein [Listeria monocytogenes]EAD0071229.1 hypothetical protein [Listeria monocytogenes]EAD5326082.1 hypothetical protein [Listeria monocytogenes]EAG6758020.1 hypothetical protein [Listeria monocytogenes]EAG9448369.1 hypothetical protein [Listeria monocytogenes]EDB3196838.1 hypothetical protein [Listeria monocytogenes]